jgi:curved DNA-binding protein CbpA
MHPDLGGDHEHAALINEAFATLSNPLKRAEYDRRLGPLDSERERRAPVSSAVWLMVNS